MIENVVLVSPERGCARMGARITDMLPEAESVVGKDPAQDSVHTNDPSTGRSPESNRPSPEASVTECRAVFAASKCHAAVAPSPPDASAGGGPRPGAGRGRPGPASS